MRNLSFGIAPLLMALSTTQSLIEPSPPPWPDMSGVQPVREEPKLSTAARAVKRERKAKRKNSKESRRKNRRR